MNKLIAFFAPFFVYLRSLVPPQVVVGVVPEVRSTLDFETEARNLIDRLDVAAKAAYARSVKLDEMAGDFLRGSQNERVYGKRTSALAGKLEAALN